MANHKILLLGGTGFLGSKLLELVPKDIELWLSYRDKPIENIDFKQIRLDLTNYNSLEEELNKVRPEIIIHVAKIYPFDDNPVKAKIVTSQLVKVVKSIGAKLIYLSSDAVFDGKKGNYKGKDKPNPITDYGKAKLAAETAIKNNLDNFIIIRTSYIYGKSAGKWDKRTTQLLDQIKQQGVVYRFKDMYRSPILVTDLAKAIWQLVNKDFRGIIHITGKRKSIFQFSQEIVESLGFNPKLIKPDFLKNSKLNIPPDTSLIQG